MNLLFYKFCVWLQNSPLGQGMRNSLYPFPTIETVHIFGLVILVSSASILDLRLLDMMFKKERVSTVVKRAMPWIWAGFSIQVVTGFFLFATKPEELYRSSTFGLKMLMIALSGANALLFYCLTYRSVRLWDTAPETPLGAKIAGGVSILLWLSVITAGRWIAYY